MQKGRKVRKAQVGPLSRFAPRFEAQLFQRSPSIMKITRLSRHHAVAQSLCCYLRVAFGTVMWVSILLSGVRG